mmetsp:Transcript_88660/g.286409  ORF Transcript_88660/g.286409 Transcript_88660/m.286409 type:complete len:222 (+) Transcript_88660:470-1135(+)
MAVLEAGRVDLQSLCVSWGFSCFKVECLVVPRAADHRSPDSHHVLNVFQLARVQAHILVRAVRTRDIHPLPGCPWLPHVEPEYDLLPGSETHLAAGPLARICIFAKHELRRHLPQHLVPQDQRRISGAAPELRRIAVGGHLSQKAPPRRQRQAIASSAATRLRLRRLALRLRLRLRRREAVGERGDPGAAVDEVGAALDLCADPAEALVVHDRGRGRRLGR